MAADLLDPVPDLRRCHAHVLVEVDRGHRSHQQAEPRPDRAKIAVLGQRFLARGSRVPRLTTFLGFR